MANRPTTISRSSWWTVVALAGIAVYGFLFFSTPLLSLPSHDGPPMVLSRGLAFLIHLTTPDDILSEWFSQNQMAASFVDRAPVLGAVLVWLGLAWWLGGSLLFRFHRDLFRDRILGSGLRFVLGLQWLSVLTFYVGWSGNMGTRWPMLIAIGTSALLAVWLRRSQSGTSTESTLQPSVEVGWTITPYERRWMGIMGIGVGAILLLYLMGCCMPPIEFDVREYHLQAPKEFFQRGRIGFMEHNIYANMPLGAEMHSLAWMILVGGHDTFTGALAGKTIIGLYGPIGALVIGGIAYRWRGSIAGWTAAVAYLSSPGIAEVSRHGLIDAVVACHAVAVFAIAAIFLEGGAQRDGTEAENNELQWGEYFLFGLLLGGAASTKYTAIPMIILPALVVAFVRLLGVGTSGRAFKMPASNKVLLQLAMTLFLGMAVSGGGWYLKNGIEAKNPVYPLLANALGGKTLDPDKISQWNRAHQVPQVLVSGQLRSDYRFSSGLLSLWEIGMTSKFLGLIIIPLGLLGAIVGFRERGWLALLIVVWILGVWWIFTHRLDRFWLPALPFVAILAGRGGDWLAASWKGWGLFIVSGLGLLYAILLIATWPFNDNRIGVALHALRYDEVIQTKSDLEMMDEEPSEAFRVAAYQHWLNKNMNPSDLVLIVGDAQVFDLEIPILYSTCFDRSPLEIAIKGYTPAERRERLKALGVTHVVVHWSELARYRSPGNYGFSDFFQKELFMQLVEERVLERVDWPIESPTADLYRVVSQ